PYSYDRLYLAKRENLKRFGPIYRERLRRATDVVQIFDPNSAGQVLRREGRLGCLEQTLTEHSTGQRILSATTRMFDATQKTMYAFPWYDMFRSPLYRQFVRAKKVCDSMATSFIEDMKRDTHALKMEPETNSNFLSSLLALNELDQQRVVAVINELFIAGIDSTANALSFVLYNLARNPKKQDILIAEIDGIMKHSAHLHITDSKPFLAALKSNNDVSKEMIDKMHFLKACVKESFRLVQLAFCR
ncbi:hypothetical protein LSH36_492g03016, partial [Paralvinella palmiformis]